MRSPSRPRSQPPPLAAPRSPSPAAVACWSRSPAAAATPRTPPSRWPGPTSRASRPPWSTPRTPPPVRPPPSARRRRRTSPRSTATATCSPSPPPTVGDVVTAGSDLDEPSADAVSAGRGPSRRPGRTSPPPRQELAAARGRARAAEQAAGVGLDTARRRPSSPIARAPRPRPAGQRGARPAGRAAVRRRPGGHHPADAPGPGGRAVQLGGGGPRDGLAPAVRRREVPRRRPAGAGGRRRGVDAPRPSSRQLADAGYYDADVDGIYGPTTVAAVQALQKANGLPQTGTARQGHRAGPAVRAGGQGRSAAAQEETASTTALQQTLKLAGYWTGPVDGQWTDELTDALSEPSRRTSASKSDRDRSTRRPIAAFEKALEKAQTPRGPRQPRPQSTVDAVTELS